ncbi:MAG: MFS transporter, partial [bacterium]
MVNLGIQENAWRWMLGAELIPATLYFCLLFLLPESPRWLVMKDRCEDAKQVLARIMPTEKVSAQIAEIKATIEDASETFIQRFRQTLKPKLRFALTVGIIIGIAQQVSGINAIYFYAPTIFEQSGVGRDAAFTQAVMIGITNVVFTLLAIAMVDKLGRKPLLVGGLLGV